MNLKEKKSQGCLEKEEIELFVIDENYNANKIVSTHLDMCYDCYVHYFELRTFQVILDYELRKPVSQQIKNLVRGMQTTNHS